MNDKIFGEAFIQFTILLEILPRADIIALISIRLLLVFITSNMDRSVTSFRFLIEITLDLLNMTLENYNVVAYAPAY